ATFGGTRRSPSGRASCSWRATTSARSRAPPTIPTSSSSVRACSSWRGRRSWWPMASDGRRSALLIDWGGVLTTHLFQSFQEHCLRAEIDPQKLLGRFRRDKEARDLLIALETGDLAEKDFEVQLAALLEVEPDGLIDGLFAGVEPDTAMVEAVRRARVG